MIAYVAAYRKELVATMANVGRVDQRQVARHRRQADLLPAHAAPDQRGVVRRATSERLPTNRHNAYRAPGGLAPLAPG